MNINEGYIVGNISNKAGKVLDNEHKVGQGTKCRRVLFGWVDSSHNILV